MYTQVKKKKRKNASVSKLTSLQMLSNKYLQKAELKEKYNAEAEERKGKFQLELEERRASLPYYKNILVFKQ